MSGAHTFSSTSPPSSPVLRTDAGGAVAHDRAPLPPALGAFGARAGVTGARGYQFQLPSDGAFSPPRTPGRPVAAPSPPSPRRQANLIPQRLALHGRGVRLAGLAGFGNAARPPEVPRGGPIQGLPRRVVSTHTRLQAPLGRLEVYHVNLPNLHRLTLSTVSVVARRSAATRQH